MASETIDKSSAAHPEPPPTSITQIDPSGDLLLDIGSSTCQRRYQVCSRTLSRSSPVWKAMLYRPFMEGKPEDKDAEWVVTLPEDSTAAFEVILGILHVQFERVPKYPSLALLFQITIATDKYDLTHILRPWSNSWLQGNRPFSSKVSDCTRLLWIAWELGSISIFRDRAACMVRICTVDSQGRALDDSTQLLSSSSHLSSIGILGMFDLLPNNAFASNTTNLGTPKIKSKRYGRRRFRNSGNRLKTIIDRLCSATPGHAAPPAKRSVISTTQTQ